MAGQVLFFMAVCYTYRAIPALDRRKIAASAGQNAGFGTR